MTSPLENACLLLRDLGVRRDSCACDLAVAALGLLDDSIAFLARHLYCDGVSSLQRGRADATVSDRATGGRGSGVVGYNVQVAVNTEHHLIITHEVTNVGTDRSQLAHVAKETKATLEAENLDVVVDRGYFNSEEILACEEAGITVTLPKPMTSNSKAEGRFGKQD